ncbi:unnamed protein product, partial [Symbiodinium necroappetens]
VMTFDTKGAATASYKGESKEIQDIKSRMPTRGQMEQNRMRYSGKVGGDADSTCPEKSGSEDEDMGFFSFRHSRSGSSREDANSRSRSLRRSFQMPGHRGRSRSKSLDRESSMDIRSRSRSQALESRRSPAEDFQEQDLEGLTQPDPVEEPVAAAEKEVPKQPSGKGKGRGKAKAAANKGSSRIQKIVNKAQQLFDSKQTQLSDNNLWSAKTKTRMVQQGAQALEDTAANLMPHGEDDESAKQLIGDMLAFAEAAKKKYELFSRLRAGLATWPDSDLSLTQEVASAPELGFVPDSWYHTVSQPMAGNGLPVADVVYIHARSVRDVTVLMNPVFNIFVLGDDPRWPPSPPATVEPRPEDERHCSSSDEPDSDGESPPGSDSDDHLERHQKKRKKTKKDKKLKKDKKKTVRAPKKQHQGGEGTRQRWHRSFKATLSCGVHIDIGDACYWPVGFDIARTQERSLLVSLAPSMVADILVSNTREVLKGLEKDEGSSYAFFRVLANDMTEPAAINMSIYADSFRNKSTAPGTARAVGSLQQQLLNMFWDRLFRIKDVACVRAQMESLPVSTLDLPKLPANYEPDAVVMQGDAKYCAMVMFEIEVVRSMTVPFAEESAALKLWSAVVNASKRCLSMESILQRCASATQVATKAKDAITDVAAFLEWASNESLVDELLAVRTSLESAEEMMAEADVPADLRNANSVVAELVNSFGNNAIELYAETVVDAAPCTADAVQARKNVIEGRPLFLGLWKLMRSYDTNAKAWMDVNENLAKCYASATSEVMQLLSNVAAVEHSLDAASFKAAATSVHKIQQSKAQQVVCAATQSEQQGDMEQEKVDVPSCLQILATKMFATIAALKDRPAEWFKALVRAQKHGEILGWDASTRSQLGFAVEKLVRGFVLVDDFLGKKKSVPFAENKWYTKASVRESATAISDLSALAAENSEANELPGVQDALTALTARATGTVESLVHDMRKIKDDIRAVYDDTCALVKDVDGMDEDSSDFPETLRAIVDKYNQSGSPMQDCTRGALELKKLEDVAEAFRTWSKDFPECVTAVIKHLSEQLSAAPTSSQALCGVYQTMAMEIVVRASAVPAEDTEEAAVTVDQVQKDAQGLGKFMSGQLMLSKKEIAGKIQFRLEKVIKSGKDAKTGGKGKNKGAMPPPATTPTRHGFDLSKLVMGCDFRRSIYARMCGNAMSVPVIGALLLAVLMTTGLRDEYKYPRLHFRAISAAAEQEVPDDDDVLSDNMSESDAESDEL